MNNTQTLTAGTLLTFLPSSLVVLWSELPQGSLRMSLNRFAVTLELHRSARAGAEWRRSAALGSAIHHNVHHKALLVN